MIPRIEKFLDNSEGLALRSEIFTPFFFTLIAYVYLSEKKKEKKYEVFYPNFIN